MKKLLTTIFMAVLTVSVFATVNVETETPSVDHDGACERVGSMRFIVTNDQDYQSASTSDPITVKIELTDGAVLCHDLDGTDDTNNLWVELEVDGTMWQPLDVLARGSAGSNYIEVIIRDNPNDGGALPNPSVQAWFRLGSTVLINGGPFSPRLYDDTFTLDASSPKTQGVPVCVNYTAHPGGVDQFPQNAFNVISLTTWKGGLGGTFLGVSYSPANPAIAYGGSGSTHNFVVDSNCNPKTGSDFDTEDVTLCQCYAKTTEQKPDGTEVTTYECKDLYRVGTLDLDTPSCDVWVGEDGIGMLPANSTITMTVVDASGAAIDVAFASVPGLTPMGTTTLNLDPAVAGTAVTATNANTSVSNGYIPDDGVCDMSGKDECVGNAYNLVESYSWNVSAASTVDPGKLQLDDVDLARNTADGAVTAYLKISWSPFPCGSGGSIILTDYPLNFVVCPPEPTVTPVYNHEYEYFTYFPATNAQWWAGLAVTNSTLFYQDYVEGWGTDQDVDITLYLITDQGDVYMYNAGTLPKSGILVTVLSDQTFAPTPVDPNGPTWDGSRRFWVIVDGKATIPDTFIGLDGFGMLGDGNQGQGTLPRVLHLGVYGNAYNK